MGKFRTLEIKQSVFADNDRRADEVRKELKEKKVFLLNLMSSPGSGKTTTLTRTIESLKDRSKAVFGRGRGRQSFCGLVFARKYR